MHTHIDKLLTDWWAGLPLHRTPDTRTTVLRSPHHYYWPYTSIKQGLHMY